MSNPDSKEQNIVPCRAKVPISFDLASYRNVIMDEL